MHFVYASPLLFVIVLRLADYFTIVVVKLALLLTDYTWLHVTTAFAPALVV